MRGSSPLQCNHRYCVHVRYQEYKTTDWDTGHVSSYTY